MKRICMWSGPRNLSTTMMRSFGGRADTVCSDEPFYAAYLKLTGLDHPIADEIIATHDADATRVAASLSRVPAKPAAIWYQKHMCHHMIKGVPRDFMAGATHIFLIRDPARVIASWVKKHPKVTLADIAVEQQCTLYDEVSDLYGPPPVIDTDILLQDPKAQLKHLCQRIDIPWDEGMLTWPQGDRPEDGIWGKVWYDAVWQSTGFAKSPSTPPAALDRAYQPIADAAMPFYNRMKETLVS